MRPAIRIAVLAVLAAAACRAAGPAAFPFRNPSLSLEARVADLIGRMTLEEKASQLGNESPPIPRLGIPAYDWWSEALHGVARAGRATVFPQAIGLAATWDTALMLRVATAISLEARAKYQESQRLGTRGIYEGLTFFSPNINLFRDPRWGRGMETYGEDPFLTGRLAVAFVRGMQGDDPYYFRTVATPKHFAVHSGPEPDRHTFNAVVSERDFRQTYLPQFEAAVVEGGAFSVMCAYNRVYGDPACASRRLLTDILRKEWGFPGYVTSDCWAITDIHEHHKVAPDEATAAAMALGAGDDIACGPEYRSLPQAVARGLIPESAVDTALARLLRARFRLGLFDPPDLVPYAAIPPGVNDSPEHHALARETADESIVLLKNDGDLLPLGSRFGRIAVIGPNANDVDVLLGNYNGEPSAPVTPLAGLRDAAAEHGAQVSYARGSDLAPGVPSLEIAPESVLTGLTATYFGSHDFSGTPFAVRPESTVDYHWWRNPPLPGMPPDSFSVRWTGTLMPPVAGRYALGVRAMGSVRLFLDDSLIVEFSERHVVATQSAWVNLEARAPRRLRLEFFDRRPDASVQLLWAPPAPAPTLLDDAVAAARSADVAVLFLGLSPSLEGEEMPVRVPGFAGGDRVSIGLPDPQEALLRAVSATGTPVVLVLLSGSALAIPWAAEHVAAILEAWYPGQAAGQAIADVLFGAVSPSGRLPVTFYRSVSDLPPFASYNMEGRTYRYFRGQALFPFGHGLSYSRFRYRDLRLPEAVRAGDSVAVSVEVENAGAVPAGEVVQVYLTKGRGSAPEAVRTLAGFQRVLLAPAERRRVSFLLRPEALSPGSFQIAVGGKQPGQRGTADAATTEVLSVELEVRGR
jgi:beta-glucosidase